MSKLPTRPFGLLKILWHLKEKEILKVKNKRNVSFLEARKIVGSYIGESTYTFIAHRADTINLENKYRTLIEKLILFELKFQEHLKKLLSDKFQQAQTQQQVRNKEKSKEVVRAKTHIGFTTPTRTTPPKSVKSPNKIALTLVSNPFTKNCQRQTKKLVSQKKGKNLNKGHKLLLAKLEKYRWTLKRTMKDQEVHSNCPQQNYIQSSQNQEQSHL